uniref:Glucose/ribitol dehydrogenase n=1 Tax=Lactuca sativa TaxID=4236 RepID=A0A9R1W4N4_LACSA|nr:hypothetical protein LSAT_V11C300104510 [Lactuca sativa]
MTWISIFTGKSGFAASSTAEDVTKGVDGTGLTAIVTGATSGIGLETAHVLALRGVHVVMPVRNMESGKKVKESIVEKIPNAKLTGIRSTICITVLFKGVSIEHLDVRQRQIRIMSPPFSLSKDNIELQFATNHVGNFLLTNLLLDTMKKTVKESGKEGRIVILSSEIHMMTYKEGIRFDKINDEKSYSAFSAYGQSKLANVLHAKELTRRFQEEGVKITANAVHPGVIATNLARNGGFNAFFYGVFNRILKNIPQGTATTCYVALNPQVEGVSGEYFADSNLVKASKHAQDAELAKKLWDFSMNLTKSN